MQPMNFMNDINNNIENNQTQHQIHPPNQSQPLDRNQNPNPIPNNSQNRRQSRTRYQPELKIWNANIQSLKPDTLFRFIKNHEAHSFISL